MKDEIKEIKINKSNHSIVIIKNGVTVKEQFAIDDEILDYITNLQEKIDDLENRLENAVADCNLRLQEIKTLYRYTPEKGFELVGDEDVKNKR